MLYKLVAKVPSLVGTGWNKVLKQMYCLFYYTEWHMNYLNECKCNLEEKFRCEIQCKVRIGACYWAVYVGDINWE